jgi:dTDP-4-dehydrorhamnose 3,5-epimerase
MLTTTPNEIHSPPTFPMALIIAPIFSHHVTAEFSAENKRMAWMLQGFAHAFLALSEIAEFLYKTTDDQAPEFFKRSTTWSNPAINIEWPLLDEPTLSAKDQQANPFAKVGYVT